MPETVAIVAGVVLFGIVALLLFAKWEDRRGRNAGIHTPSNNVRSHLRALEQTKTGVDFFELEKVLREYREQRRHAG